MMDQDPQLLLSGASPERKDFSFSMEQDLGIGINLGIGVGTIP